MRVINLQKSDIFRQNNSIDKKINYSKTIKDNFQQMIDSRITFTGVNREYVQAAYDTLNANRSNLNSSQINIAKKSINLFKALLRAENSIDINAITSHFKNKLKIDVDFSGDKILAAYSALTTNIYQKLGLALPSGIYAGDVTKLSALNDPNSTVMGCCYTFVNAAINQSLQDVLKKSIVFKPRTVVFSSLTDWKEQAVDSIYQTAIKHHPSPHFLNIQMHEFAHSAHFDNIFKRYGYPYPNTLGYKDGNGKQVLDDLEVAYNNMLQKKVSKNISEYAATNRFETIAEQFSYKIAESLDKEYPQKAPLITNSLPSKLQKLINNAWEGYL